ncbi:MAG: hypothetical protein ACLP50_05545 [Solirubrobacteraceae bacterium]
MRAADLYVEENVEGTGLIASASVFADLVKVIGKSTDAGKQAQAQALTDWIVKQSQRSIDAGSEAAKA